MYFHSIPYKLKKYATVNSEDTYQELLRRKFKQTMGIPSWAVKTVKQSETNDNDLDDLMVSIKDEGNNVLI